jgi:hypothetical protein
MGLDQALADLAPFGASLANGLTNHAPMVAEALEALGRDAEIQPWVTSELPRIRERPDPHVPIDSDRWQDGLGDPQRFTDWSHFFHEALQEGEWTDVLDRWAARLAPGFATAAAHSVIRVGHAARALGRKRNDARIGELADGLAAWTTYYIELPTASGEQLGLSPTDALARVELVDPSDRSPQGSITAALGQLANYPGFANVVDWVDIAQTDIEDIAQVFARLFLQSAHTALGAIVFTHAITGLAAARNIRPYVGDSTGQRLVQSAWHTGCALHAVYSENVYENAERQEEPANSETIASAAIEHGDEHVIKLAEACIAFHAARQDPHFPLAAARCRELIPARETTR